MQRLIAWLRSLDPPGATCRWQASAAVALGLLISVSDGGGSSPGGPVEEATRESPQP